MSYIQYSSLCAVFLLLIGFALRTFDKICFQRWAPIKTQNGTLYSAKSSEKNGKIEPPLGPYQDIKPLADFDWKATEPIKLRPFKPRFHLTMALQNTTISELVPIDNTYLDRIALRRALLPTLTNEAIAAHPLAHAAVREFYTWLFSTYLPRRYPPLFTLSPNATHLSNNLTHDTIPLPAPTDPLRCLRTIASHIDDDFLFLLPHTASPSEDPQYILRAYATLFPSGFNPAAKLNRTLRAIHAPVPSYAAKLALSMDRFFRTLPVGKVVQRANWTVTTGRALHVLGGTHASEAEMAGGLDAARESVDLAQTVLRAERQTVHRLAGSGAVVFAFKTYTYELGDVVAEGLGEELAVAIEGLGEGSVQGMRGYKRGDVWGEKVCAFLRRGTM